MKTLTQHEIVLKKAAKIEKSEKQTRGQLMGSITSFPILNLVNAGVNRLLFKDKKKLESLKICVNGDDIALGGCNFEEHKDLNTYVGSKLSAGKVFYSKDFMNINSRFLIHLESGREIGKIVERNHELKQITRMQRWTEVNYIPMAIITNGSNNGSITNFWMDMIGQAGTRYVDCVKSWPEKEPQILSLFKKYNSEYFKKVRIPYYIPTWLGGLGLYTDYTSRFISTIDKKLANLIMGKMKEGKFPRNLNHSKKEWLFWDLAEAKVKKNPDLKITTTSVKASSGCELYKNEIAAEVFQLFIDPKVKLQDIFNKEVNKLQGKEKSNAKRSESMRDKVFKMNLRYNEKLWDPKNYKTLDVTPVSEKGLDMYEVQKTLRPPSEIENIYQKAINNGSIEGNLKLMNTYSRRVNESMLLLPYNDERSNIIKGFVNRENKKLFNSRVDFTMVSRDRNS